MIVPFYEMTETEMRQHRLQAIKTLKNLAAKRLGGVGMKDLVVRDLIVGDEDAGDTTNLPVDIQDAPAGTEQRTDIRGWAQDADDLTAETLDMIYDDAVSDDQVIGVIGLVDLSGVAGIGDQGALTYVRIKDSQNIKAFFNAQRIYAGDPPYGCFFIDQDSGRPAVITFDENDDFQIQIAVQSLDTTDKQILFETYVAEKIGKILTGTKAAQ